MRRSRRSAQAEKAGPAGFLIVDKPPGWTSHDVVEAARGWLGTRRVGHLGTLDPLATGVLPLVVREATKLVPFVEGGPKVYVGAVRLGEETDTLDAEGRILRRHEGPLPEEEEVVRALANFVGDIEQIPPMFSAVKRGGVPLHRLARRGQEVVREPKAVHIARLELHKYTPPRVDIEVECSTGTYVRSLAADLGAHLGCGAHLASLCRTRSGCFTLEQAAAPEVLEKEAAGGRIEARLIPSVTALGFPAVRLTAAERSQVIHGGAVASGARLPEGVGVGTRIAGVGPEGDLVAVMEVRAGRSLQPLRVLRSVAQSG